MTPFLTPNAKIPKRQQVMIALAWGVLAVVCWQFIDVHFLPKPTEIIEALGPLNAHGVFEEFGTSLWTMFEAVLWTVAISLTFAYTSIIPVVTPIAKFISGLRYLGLVGLMVAFNLMAPDGHTLKVMVLTFGMTVFYLRDMISVVNAIPQEDFNHGMTTLGMSKFPQLRVMYEVVILGTLNEAIESLRVNAAMGWMMLTMVEGVVQSEGGIGVVLIQLNRHMDLTAEGAILLSLFVLGLCQDAMIGFVKNFIVCPYARLGRS